MASPPRPPPTYLGASKPVLRQLLLTLVVAPPAGVAEPWRRQRPWPLCFPQHCPHSVTIYVFLYVLNSVNRAAALVRLDVPPLGEDLLWHSVDGYSADYLWIILSVPYTKHIEHGLWVSLSVHVGIRTFRIIFRHGIYYPPNSSTWTCIFILGKARVKE